MSSSESDASEPFQSSGSEYVPSDENLPSTSGLQKIKKIVKQISSNESERGPINLAGKADIKIPKGKKRTRNEEIWQRNIRNIKMAKGEEYVTAKTGKVMPKREVGKDCECRRKCFLKTSEQQRNQILQQFNNLADKEKQDIYLAGLITVKNVARKRIRSGNGREKSVTFSYKVRVDGSEFIICRSALCAVHGITKHRVVRIATVLRSRTSAPPDMRDTCQTCDRLQNAIQAEQDVNAKTALQTEKQLHIRKADTFYSTLKEKTALAKTDDTIEMLCFDFQQNLSLPHVPAGDVFYKRQLWLYNFCVYSGKSGWSTFYMFDEVTSKKGSNEVISFLEHYIENFLPDTVIKLYLFSDNAFAQNKNHTMVKYLYTLVNTNNRIKEVIHQYPEPGHSFLPCDRSFGLIEKEKRKKERVHVPEEWKDLVRKTSKRFRVVEVNQEIVRDFNSHFKPIFKTTFSSTDKFKFLISTYRIFKYVKGSNFFECSLATGMPLFTRFSALKSRTTTVLSLPTSKMIQAYPLPINEKKLQDVKTLVEKYVPAVDQWYYKHIFGGEPTVEPPPEDEIVKDRFYESDSSFI